MACDSVINSATVGMSIDDVVVAYSNDCSIQFTHEPREITNKDSNGWADFAEGLRGWSGSVSAWYTAAGNSATSVFAKISTRATVNIHVLEINTSEADAIGGMVENYSGKAWVTNLDIASPGTQENVSFTAGFRGCGEASNNGVIPS